MGGVSVVLLRCQERTCIYWSSAANLLNSCACVSLYISCHWSSQFLMFWFVGKDTGSFYWHGRDNKTTRELNPKVLLKKKNNFHTVCSLVIWRSLADILCYQSIGTQNSWTQLEPEGHMVGKTLAYMDAYDWAHGFWTRVWWFRPVSDQKQPQNML